MFDQQTVKFWLQEAKSCEARQKDELIKRNCYPYIINYYEGDQYADESKKNEANIRRQCFINEYFPNTNALIAEIMFQNPDILTEPLKPDAEGNEPIMKSALMYGFKKLELLTENRLGLFDMIMAGYCAIEVNHINNKKTETIPQSDMSPDKNLLQKAGDFIKETFSADKTEEEIEKTIPALELAYATKDETYGRRWNPLNILLDYQADRVKDLRYIIKKIYLSTSRFKAMYPDFADKVKATEPIEYSAHQTQKDKLNILLYEFQLKQHDGKMINFIISPSYGFGEIDYFERPYTTNGFNVKIGTLNEYGKLYPISFGKINKYVQDDINNYTTFMMEVAERNVPKIGINENVDIEGETALRSSDVNGIVKVKGKGDPRASIVALPATAVSNDNKDMIGILSRQKDKLWSVSQERQGVSSRPEFAEQLKIQEAGFIARQSDIQEGLRKLMKSEVETLKDIIVQFWDEPMFFKITGGPKPSWYIPQMVINPLTGEQMVENALTDILTMDYDIDIDIASSLKPNRERKKQELIEFAKWITSQPTVMFAQQQGYYIDISVIKKAAKEWGWNPDELIKNIRENPQVMDSMFPPTPEEMAGGPVAGA